MMRVTIWCSVFCLVLLSAACSKPDDVTLIDNAIDAIEEGVEQNSMGRVLERLADDFRGNDGLGRREVRSLMFYYFRRYPSITVLTSNRDIRVQGERADVTLDALLLGGKGLLPERGRRYALSMRWHKQGDEWLLARINWQSANGG
jgi:hypothetical protein